MIHISFIIPNIGSASMSFLSRVPYFGFKMKGVLMVSKFIFQAPIKCSWILHNSWKNYYYDCIKFLNKVMGYGLKKKKLNMRFYLYLHTIPLTFRMKVIFFFQPVSECKHR